MMRIVRQLIMLIWAIMEVIAPGDKLIKAPPVIENDNYSFLLRPDLGADSLR